MKHVHSVAAVVFSLACGSALAQVSPGTTLDFAVLGGAAVTCTVSSVQGDVGLANPGTITNTSCAITGAIEEGTQAAQTAYATFLKDYANLATEPQCDFTNFVADNTSATLAPGVYCFDAAVTQTGTTWTLDGSCTDTWIFRIGTGGTGALTGTNFTVVNPDCATCNNDVLWWTAEAATLTDSTFIGSILAGADITVTRGSLAGQVLAGGIGTTLARTGAVTLTGTVIDFCTANTPPPGPPLLPVFVIGDVEPHAVGNVVNFWGAQWWKNNIMSGFVGPGASRASFKGFATRAELQCGGVWESRPGNSPPPPRTIPADIAVVVTSTVVKDGPNLRGNITEIVVVHQDGGYGPNPGHAGNGRVSSIVCQADAAVGVAGRR